MLDGYVLPSKYLDQLVKGPANNALLMPGSTKDEKRRVFISTNYTVEEFNKYCSLESDNYGKLFSRYFELYSADEDFAQASIS